MSRHDTELDPVIARELDELEALFADDLRAVRPRMEPAFQATMDARVDEWRLKPARGRRLWFAPAAGVAAAALIALVVATGGQSGSTDDGASGGASVAAGPSETAAQDEGAGGSTAATKSLATPAAPNPAGDTAARGFARKVERSTQLALSTSPDDVQSVADDVVSTVQRFGGIVISSQINTNDDGGDATFSLRVPTRRLDEAVAALSKLAHVANLSQATTDITSSFVSVADQLSDARSERRALLVALGKATTDQQIDAIKQRLRDERSRIAALRGQLNSLRRRADLSSVDVTVTGDGKKDSGGGAWTPGDAANDALDVLRVMAGVALIALAIGVPLALLAALAGLAARGSRRRRREGALDGV